MSYFLYAKIFSHIYLLGSRYCCEFKMIMDYQNAMTIWLCWLEYISSILHLSTIFYNETTSLIFYCFFTNSFLNFRDIWQGFLMLAFLYLFIVLLAAISLWIKFMFSKYHYCIFIIKLSVVFNETRYLTPLRRLNFLSISYINQCYLLIIHLKF